MWKTPEQIDVKSVYTKDDLESTNFGGIIGIGIIKKIGGSSELYFDARASYSFNHILSQIKMP